MSKLQKMFFFFKKKIIISNRNKRANRSPNFLLFFLQVPQNMLNQPTKGFEVVIDCLVFGDVTPPHLKHSVFGSKMYKKEIAIEPRLEHHR
jgi:hypothetical protein